MTSRAEHKQKQDEQISKKIIWLFVENVTLEFSSHKMFFLNSKLTIRTAYHLFKWASTAFYYFREDYKFKIQKEVGSYFLFHFEKYRFRLILVKILFYTSFNCPSLKFKLYLFVRYVWNILFFILIDLTSSHTYFTQFHPRLVYTSYNIINIQTYYNTKRLLFYCILCDIFYFKLYLYFKIQNTINEALVKIPYRLTLFLSVTVFLFNFFGV